MALPFTSNVCVLRTSTDLVARLGLGDVEWLLFRRASSCSFILLVLSIVGWRCFFVGLVRTVVLAMVTDGGACVMEGPGLRRRIGGARVDLRSTLGGLRLATTASSVGGSVPSAWLAGSVWKVCSVFR